MDHLFSRAGDPGTSDADCACICYDTGSFQSDGRGSAVRICGSDQKRNCLVSEDIAGRCGRDQCASGTCLLYTSDAADEEDSVDLGGRRIIKKKKRRVGRE